MTAFVIYDSATGAVRGTFLAHHSDEDAAIMAANTPAGCGALAADPSSPVFGGQKGWSVVSGALVMVPPTDAQLLAAAQSAQSSAIETAYQAHIDNGFTSSALGSSYLYPGTAVDQQNLNAVITASMIPGQPADWSTVFWCAPAGTPTVWNYATHTAAQIHQVGIDAMNYIMAAKMRRAQLNGQIQAATTVAAVQAVVW
jgi:hypothetical protein